MLQKVDKKKFEVMLHIFEFVRVLFLILTSFKCFLVLRSTWRVFERSVVQY